MVPTIINAEPLGEAINSQVVEQLVEPVKTYYLHDLEGFSVELAEKVSVDYCTPRSEKLRDRKNANSRSLNAFQDSFF